jgi:hypothetical protein
MSDAHIGVNYTPLGQSTGGPAQAASLPAVSVNRNLFTRYCSIKVIMLGFGITAVTVLTALLIVFLAPGRAQSVSDPGADYYSPPYYPARIQSPKQETDCTAIANGSGAWADAYTKAKAMVAHLTTLEKVAFSR